MKNTVDLINSRWQSTKKKKKERKIGELENTAVETAQIAIPKKKSSKKKRRKQIWWPVGQLQAT